MTRSRLYSVALQRSVQEHDGDAITAKLNEVYSTEESVVILEVFAKKTRDYPKTGCRFSQSQVEEVHARCGDLIVKTEKKKKLEKAGWKLGSARDFLGLDASEAEFVEIKLGLARRLRELREQHS